MDDAALDAQLAAWTPRAQALEDVLRPIVRQEVDLDDPASVARLENAPHPADATGQRDAIVDLFEEVLAAFEALEAAGRQRLVDWMAGFDALLYSAVIDADVETEEGFRKMLLLFVVEDQGKDTRDAIVTLAQVRQDGERLGFDVDGLFREMAEIASRRNKFGWGSTRDLFLRRG